MAAKKKAAKAGAGAMAAGHAVRSNTYVQRVVEDDELRDNLRTAFESARKAYTRMNGKRPTKALMEDKGSTATSRRRRRRCATRRTRCEARRSGASAAGAAGCCCCSASSARGSRSRSARACARRSSTPCSALRRSSVHGQHHTPPRRPARASPSARPDAGSLDSLP